MKINPIIIFNIFIIIFIIIDIILLYFLFKIQLDNVFAYIFLVLIALFLSFILYKINGGMKFNPTKGDINKQGVFFNNEGFVIDYPITQTKKHIKWNSIEAIFLENSIPREGDYYSFQYTFILKESPLEENYKDIKWYNKISLVSNKTKKYKTNYIVINDYNNKDFFKIKDQLMKYLKNINTNIDYYLSLKYGNKRDNLSSKIQTTGFYKIYDLNNDIDYPILNKYRKYTENEQ